MIYADLDLISGIWIHRWQLEVIVCLEIQKIEQENHRRILVQLLGPECGKEWMVCNFHHSLPAFINFQFEIKEDVGDCRAYIRFMWCQTESAVRYCVPTP